MHTCLGESCERQITDRFALCRQCEELYGKKVAQWPTWLRFMWNSEQRERRQQRRINKHEVPITIYDT